jgi:hypothetical protein
MTTKISLAVIGLAAISSSTAIARDSDRSWSKSYPVTGKPTLTLETSDASVEFHPCEACGEIRIHVEVVGQKLSDYRLDEGQSGDGVHFLFKELHHIGVHITWHREQTRVTVETPAQLTLEAKTSDGNVTLAGLQGELNLTTSDGDIAIDHVSGDLRIKSGDGNVKITNAEGAIDARTSDGRLTVDGLFHAVALHTTDGTLALNLRQGTRLTEASTIQSSDGSVTLHVPHNLAVDLDVHTGDGHVDCALPVTMDHYRTGGGDAHELHGKLNGGGVPLTIRTRDGNVKIVQI